MIVFQPAMYRTGQHRTTQPRNIEARSRPVLLWSSTTERFASEDSMRHDPQDAILPQPASPRIRRKVSPSARSPPPPYASSCFLHLHPSPCHGEIDQDPPPYSLRHTSPRQASSQPTLGCSTSSDTFTIERLRRFLSFTLSVDYDLQTHTPDHPTASDWSHFVCLARQVSDIFSAARGTFSNDLSHPDFWLEELMTPAVRKQIRDPALALGIPPIIVVQQLRLFISSIWKCKNGTGGYVSRLESVPHDQNLCEFGRKLLSDRTILVDAVLPKYRKAMCPYRGLRMVLRVRIQTMIDRWFIRLDTRGYKPKAWCQKYDKPTGEGFPVEIFEKETKGVGELLEMLRTKEEAVNEMWWWERWKVRRAKMREEGSYLVEGRERRQREREKECTCGVWIGKIWGR